METKENYRQHRVLVLTTSRADYGILRPLLYALSRDAGIDLRLVVTGTHLSDDFGRTIQEIEDDPFLIDAAIPILTEENNSPQAMSHILANAVRGFGDYFQMRKPDIFLVLGDRYEAFAACIAAVNACIPIGHLHGGETTEGAMDECFRHSITKMSHIHFTAAEPYRNRVIQLGEAPERVFNVGALGVENALHTPCIGLDQLEAELNFSLPNQRYAVVTFHAVTLEPEEGNAQLEELLAAIAERNDLNFLITKSNSDIAGQCYNKRLDRFAEEHRHCCVITSLGMVRYMTALRHSACVIGNSSSGLIEAPSFGIPTINIGNRQRGRIQADSVVNCPPQKEAILSSLDTVLSEQFRFKAAGVKNPYGDGNTSIKIAGILKDVLGMGRLDLKKKFYDIPFCPESI